MTLPLTVKWALCLELCSVLEDVFVWGILSVFSFSYLITHEWYWTCGIHVGLYWMPTGCHYPSTRQSLIHWLLTNSLQGRCPLSQMRKLEVQGDWVIYVWPWIWSGVNLNLSPRLLTAQKWSMFFQSPSTAAFPYFTVFFFIPLEIKTVCTVFRFLKISEAPNWTFLLDFFSSYC